MFLRIQTFDRVDNDLVRFFKSIGRGFATVYSTIVRGTPMMVQGLLIYYAGFTVLRGMGFETAQANQIWSTFTAGLVTISLNSTAYMMEGPARRHRVHRPRPGRGGALAGSVAVAGYAQGRVPPGH